MKHRVLAGIALSMVASTAGAEEGHHVNHVAVFGGAVSTSEHSGAAVGMDVERRVRRRVGVAVAMEGTQIENEMGVLVVPAVVMHPWRGVKVLGGVGWEHAHGHDEVVLRAGAGYDVHVGGVSVGPAVAVDRAGGGTAVVGGVAVGAGF